MAIIGKNTPGAFGPTRHRSARAHRLAAQHYLSGVGEAVTRFWVHATVPVPNGASIQMAAYVINPASGVPTTRIGAITSIPVRNPGPSWWSSDPVNIPLPDNKTIGLALYGAPSVTWDSATNGESIQFAFTLPTTWSETGIGKLVWAMYAEVGAAITSTRLDPCCAQLL